MRRHPISDVPQLGERGGGWVALQFLLIAVVLVLGFVGPDWPEAVGFELGVAGVVIASVGVIVVVLAARELGSGLTPFPSPSSRGRLVERGLYRVVRHPIYLGGILFFTGISLDASPLALAGTAVLAVLWGLKARVEEGFLSVRYPDYDEYCRRTRFRLVPFVY
jgi:protein-S-isoprenylcysteine O-methyltransferase Ste14